MYRFPRIVFYLTAVMFLVAGCDKEKDFLPEQVSDLPSNGFKLMSFNVRYENSGDNSSGNGWAVRRKGVYEMMKTERPTLMGVQECLAGQRHDILSNVNGYEAIGVGRDDGNEKGEMMAIFYLRDSVEVIDWGTFWLSATPENVSKSLDAACYRTCTWARFRHKRIGRDFVYFNTHLDHKGKTARSESMKLIVSKMKEINPEGLPCVLSADFNTVEDDPILGELHEVMKSARKTAPVSDSYSTANSFKSPSLGSKSIIDHIFYNGLEVSEYRTVRESWKGIEYISDHYPVYAVFSFI